MTYTNDNRMKIMNKVIVMLIFLIFSISTITALEIDNVKDYNSQEKEVTITNAFGLGSDLGKIKLINYTQLCFPGECYAYYELTNYQDNIKTLEGTKYYDKEQKNLKQSKEVKYEIYDPTIEYSVPTYETKCEVIYNEDTGLDENVCNPKESGSEIKHGQYITYNPNQELDSGTYLIREKIDILPGETVDVVPKFYGVDITEWVLFTGMTRLEYYNTGDDNGNQVDGRIIRQSFTVGSVGPNQTYTSTGLSYKGRAFGSQGDFIAYIYNATNETNCVTGQIVSQLNSVTNVPDPGDIWQNYTFDTNGTLLQGKTYCLEITTTTASGLIWRADQSGASYSGGQSFDFNGANEWVDTIDMMFEIWGVTQTDTVFPAINLTYPRNVTYSLNVTSLEYTYFDANPGSCWFTRNGGATNSSIVNAGINFTVFSVQGNNTWTLYCNDTAGNTNSSTISFTQNSLKPMNLSLYEYFNTGDDNGNTVDSRIIRQSFTVGTTGPNVSYDIQGFSYKGRVFSNQGIFNVYIYNATNETNCVLPEIVAKLSALSNVAPPDPGDYWQNYTFDQNGTLFKGKTYCVEINNTNATDLLWRADQTTPSFTGGQSFDFTGGNAWDPTIAMMFMTWGVNATFPPIVTLNSPANNFIVNTTNSANFNCSATDDVGVLSLQFYLNGVIQQTVTNTSANQNLSLLNSSNLALGTYNWTCKASDGNFTTFATNNRTVIISNVAFHSPYNVSADDIGGTLSLSTDLQKINDSDLTTAITNTTSLASNYIGFRINNQRWILPPNVSNVTYHYIFEVKNGALDFFMNDQLKYTNNISGDKYFSNLSLAFNPGAYHLKQKMPYGMYNNTNGTLIITGPYVYGIFNIVAFLNESYITYETDDIFPNISVNLTSGQVFNKGIQNSLYNITIPVNNSDNYLIGTDNSGFTTCYYTLDSNNPQRYNCTNSEYSNATILNLTSGNHNVIFNVIDDAGNSFTSSSISFNMNVTGILKNNVTYTSPVVEGQVNTIRANYSIENPTSVTLYYNGTASTPTIIANGQYYTLISNVTAPIVGNSTNITFYYVALINSVNYTSEIFTQQVINADLTLNCTNGSYNFINISNYDEELLYPINGTVEFVFKLLGNDGEISTLSGNTSGINISLCVNQNLSNSFLRYSLQLRYFGTDYLYETYNIINSEISNLPINVPLYYLNNSIGTRFTISYVDFNYITHPGAIIQLQRQYLPENMYNVVEIPQFDNNGNAVGSFNPNSVRYKLIVIENGNILDIFNDIFPACQNIVLGTCEINLRGSQTTPTSTTDDFEYTLVTENDTITLTYIIPSGTPKTIRFVSSQNSRFLQNISGCDTTVFASGGTITCGYNSTVGDSIINTQIYNSAGPTLFGNIPISEELNGFYLLNNYFIGFILLLTLALMFISSGTILVIVSSAGVVFLGLIFLIKGLDIITLVGSVGWLVVGTIIIIYHISRKEETS